MLRGEKVVLRPLEREDLRHVWELANDIEVESRVSDQPPRPSSLAKWEAWFDRRLSDPPQDAISFVIEAEGRFVGQCGLHAIDEYARRADLGIALRRDEWGKGYGQDACRVLVEYAFRHVNLRKVCLHVLADDERAVGAYRKAGFVDEGRLREHDWHDGTYRDVLLMAVLRSVPEGS